MPAVFDRCVKRGGRVRTAPNGALICFRGNKSYYGGMHKGMAHHGARKGHGSVRR
jgi:hypothetical protein